MLKNIILAIKKNFFEYGLYFLIGALFFGNALLSIASVIFYLTLLCSFAKPFSFSGFFKNKPFLFMVFYFLVNLIILITVVQKNNEIFLIQKLLPFILFPIIFFLNKNKLEKRPTIENMQKIFIFFALLSFFLSFFSSLFRMIFLERGLNTIYITYNFLSGILGVHQIYLSLFYTLALLFSLDFYFEERLPKVKKIFLITSLILFTGILLLSSRTAIFISVILILTKMVFLNWINKRKLLKFLLPTFLIAILVVFSIPTLKARIVNLNKNVASYSGLSFRTKIWKNSMEVFKESPIYGHGIYLSQKALEKQYRNSNFRRAFLGNFNAHNQYIQSLIDNGLIGLLVLLIMIFGPLLYFKGKPEILFFTIIVSLEMTTESLLVRQNGIIFFCLFYCVFLVEDNKLISKKEEFIIAELQKGSSLE